MSDETVPSPLERFRASMTMDYEKWRDGVGYDLGAIDDADAKERKAILAAILAHHPRDWRDVEALSQFDTAEARAALKDAARNGDTQTRMAVARYAPSILADPARAASLVRAIESARPFEGLSATLDEAEEFHPPEVINALLRGTLEGDGVAAVSFAALLLYIHGKAQSAFDMERRSFVIRFNTDDHAEREQAFRELCLEIGIDPVRVLKKR